MIPTVPLLFHSRRLPPDTSGVLLEVTPEQAGWAMIHFAVRQLAAGGRWQADTGDKEHCLVLLSGHGRVRWAGEGWATNGWTNWWLSCCWERDDSVLSGD